MSPKLSIGGFKLFLISQLKLKIVFNFKGSDIIVKC